MKAAVTRKRPPKRKFGEDDAKVVKPKRVHERDFGKKAGGEEKKGALKVEKRNVSKKKANKNAEKTSKPVLKTSKQLPVKRPASRPGRWIILFVSILLHQVLEFEERNLNVCHLRVLVAARTSTPSSDILNFIFEYMR